MEALAETVTVTLPDGSTRKVPAGTSLRAIAEGIGPRLAKDALAGKIDGKVVDLAAPVVRDAKVEIVTPKSPDALELYRHSTAHLTANAVKRLFPTVQIGIGPAIENGYYYDFNPERPFTPEDLAAIEAEMRKIVAEDNPVERLEMSKDEAIRIFEGQNDAPEGRDHPAASRTTASRATGRRTSSISAAGRTCPRPASSASSS